MPDRARMYAQALDAGGGPDPSQHQFTQRDPEGTDPVALATALANHIGMDPPRDWADAERMLMTAKRIYQAAGHERRGRKYPVGMERATFPDDPQFNNLRPERAPTAYYSNALRRPE